MSEMYTDLKDAKKKAAELSKRNKIKYVVVEWCIGYTAMSIKTARFYRLPFSNIVNP